MERYLLLCCTDCGRLQGHQFPLDAGKPLLLDPTVEDPWEFLDFDPKTGNLVPRVEPSSGAELPKGRETVRVLHRDRRDTLANGYRKTLRRMAQRVRQIVDEGWTNDSLKPLREADDHGLLGWCFLGLGQNDPPFADLRSRCPEKWASCQQRIAEAKS